MGAKCPLATLAANVLFAAFGLLPVPDFAALAATTKAVLGTRGALSCRDFIEVCTTLKAISVHRVNVCTIEHFARFMCSIEQRPNMEFSYKSGLKRIIGECLQ
jgi:hypothetical protein